MKTCQKVKVTAIHTAISIITFGVLNVNLLPACKPTVHANFITIIVLQ